MVSLRIGSVVGLALVLGVADPAAAGRAMAQIPAAALPSLSQPLAPQLPAPQPEPPAEARPPMMGPETLEHSRAALAFYEELAAAGGWPMLGNEPRGLKPGSAGPAVERLKVRLILTGDLAADASDGDIFDEATEAALKRFQRRHGLSETGSVGRLTTRALNVPIDVRLNQLRATVHRLEGNAFAFSERYVLVNIPGAEVEAVRDGHVERRHVAVVGRPDRPSPVLATRITSVNLNPTWTAPMSIVKADIVPQVHKDPGFLAKNRMRVIGAGNAELDPSKIDWSGRSPVNFYVRQDPGPTNALGSMKIDMPNGEAVYMHDTPKRELFRSDVRFHSSGCARISDIPALAAWLLEGSEWDEEKLKAHIAQGERRDIRLQKPVPVAWVYLTGWAAGDGAIHFRDDIYGLDTPEGLVTSTIRPRREAVAGPPLPPRRPAELTPASVQPIY